MADQDTLGVSAITNVQRIPSRSPFFLCQKIVILLEFWICFGRFLFENDPPTTGTGIPPPPQAYGAPPSLAAATRP